MDRRSRKKIKRKEVVIGIVCFFLFCLLMTAVFAGSLWRAKAAWRKDRMELIGRLAEQFPGQELEVMDAVHGQMAGAGKKDPAEEENQGQEKEVKVDYQRLAEEMLAKYGYEERRADRQGEEFRNAVLSYFVIISLIGGGILMIGRIWGRRKIRKYLEPVEKKLSLLSAGEYEKAAEEAMEPGRLAEDIFSGIEAQVDSLGQRFGVLMERMKTEKEGVKSLVTDIFHQLKTPLASMKMELELTEEALAAGTEGSQGQWQPAEAEQFVRRIQWEVKRLESLTAGLSNISRMEAEMVQLHPERCDLKETLIEAVNAVYMKAFGKQIEIELQEISEKQLFHDRKWTREAFVNLLDNAVKYSGKGTTIRIRVEELQNSVVTEIEDEGIGVPKGEYPKVFKRFYRGGSGEVQSQDGAGVGLYLVRKIVEMQGGSVMIRPAPGGGSIFRVILQKNDNFVSVNERKM